MVALFYTNVHETGVPAKRAIDRGTRPAGIEG
jgi:hypothetical protein